MKDMSVRTFINEKDGCYEIYIGRYRRKLWV